MILPAIMGATGAWWTPKKITTALWLDAADSDTITLNGSNVEQWDDKSGNARHATQETPARQPELLNNEQNSLNVIGFARASEEWFTCGNVLNIGTGNLSTFVVSKVIGSSYSGVVGKSHGQDPFDARWHILTGNNLFVCRGADNSDEDLIPALVNTPNILLQRIDRLVSHSAWEDGVEKATKSINFGTTDLTTTIPLHVGRYGEGFTAFHDGWVAEVIILQYAVGVDARQKLEGYLAHKWGLAGNLPAEHPYKSRRPRG